MSASSFDPEILQDFLTESGELLERLEGDLVTLESTPEDPELLNAAFRALHTIKGSASFLALTNLVRIAHASESALNAARSGQVKVTRGVMDLLLRAVDTIKTHMRQLRAGESLSEPDGALVTGLAAVGEGRTPEATGGKVLNANEASPTPEQGAPATGAPAAGAGTPRRLSLPPGKADLLEFLVADLDETLSKLTEACQGLASSVDKGVSGAAAADLAEQLAKAVDFFEFETMARLARSVRDACEMANSASPEAWPAASRELAAACIALRGQAEGLKAHELRDVDVQGLGLRLNQALRGDGTAGKAVTPEAPAAITAQLAAPAVQARTAATSASAPAPVPGKGEDSGEKRAATAESTIRVEVGRLESLMNLVGELVLQKNRIAAVARQLDAEGKKDSELTEQMLAAAEGLDRITSDMQVAVMRTRMQPLDKIFGKYPRLIRDLSTKTGKPMRLVVEGGETEVDKSVLEELGDPLVHLLRNSADHGIDTPEERAKAGKAPEGVITLRASHEGSHVRVEVMDDGRGLSRERIARKAVERGLTTPEQVATMNDREVYQFIFEAGFSTAEKVSDLSGRGVGMDVVRTNIEKLKGTIELSSVPGQGTTVTITIPLTVAILPAMMVGVGDEVYAVPLGNILEIVKPQADQILSIGEHPVLRLRDSVLPLVNAVELFEGKMREVKTPFAVVLSMSQKRVGLMVSKLIGQQEVVIKPLDDTSRKGRRAISGATVRDDGGVSLIVDVAELMRMAEQKHTKAVA